MPECPTAFCTTHLDFDPACAACVEVLRLRNDLRVFGWTVRRSPGSGGSAMALRCDWKHGEPAAWIPLDAEALGMFSMAPPVGPMWLSSRGLAEAACEEVSGTLCVVEHDPATQTTIISACEPSTIG